MLSWICPIKQIACQNVEMSKMSTSRPRRRNCGRRPLDLAVHAIRVELYRQIVDTIVAELGMEWVYRAIKVMALWDEALIISSID